MPANLPRRNPGIVSRMRLRLRGSIGGRGELVSCELTSGIKMKSYAGRGRLEGVRVHMVDDGHEYLRVAGILQREGLRVEEEDHARLRSALRQLRVEHLIDLPQMGIGSVRAGIATRKRQYQKKADQARAQAERK